MVFVRPLLLFGTRGSIEGNLPGPIFVICSRLPVVCALAYEAGVAASQCPCLSLFLAY